MGRSKQNGSVRVLALGRSHRGGAESSPTAHCEGETWERLPQPGWPGAAVTRLIVSAVGWALAQVGSDCPGLRSWSQPSGGRQGFPRGSERRVEWFPQHLDTSLYVTRVQRESLSVTALGTCQASQKGGYRSLLLWGDGNPRWVTTEQYSGRVVGYGTAGCDGCAPSGRKVTAEDSSWFIQMDHYFWMSEGAPGRSLAPILGVCRGKFVHLHPAFHAHRQHVVIEALGLQAPHFAGQLYLLPFKTLQPMQEDRGLREKLQGKGKGMEAAKGQDGAGREDTHGDTQAKPRNC